jgi:hypothetical protein
MSVNKYNHERYYDPTPYEALTAIEREEKESRRRPLVFICSPYAGDVERNLQNARRYCKYAVEQGAVPIAPHLIYPQFLDDRIKAQRSLGLYFGLVILEKCDEIWVFGSAISIGMRQEIERAQALGIRIRFYNNQGVEVK